MSIVTVPLRGHQAPLGAAFFLVAEGRWVRPHQSKDAIPELG